MEWSDCSHWAHSFIYLLVYYLYIYPIIYYLLCSYAPLSSSWLKKQNEEKNIGTGIDPHHMLGYEASGRTGVVDMVLSLEVLQEETARLQSLGHCMEVGGGGTVGQPSNADIIVEDDIAEVATERVADSTVKPPSYTSPEVAYNLPSNAPPLCYYDINLMSW